MKSELRYTLLADGSSDRVLVPILNWVFDRQHPEWSYRPQFADRLPIATRSLAERARQAIRLYPCDILFVHRDAERQSHESRIAEIRAEMGRIDKPSVPIVPVRMTEAWLFSGETAIRQAANNPHGTQPLGLPSSKDWDQLPDPKDTLLRALTDASGLPPRRRRSFSPEQARHRVAELTDDFSALERLPAFTSLQRAIAEAVNQIRCAPVSGKAP